MTKVKSHFSNIREKISKELREARHSIYVASAYFTDYALADILSQKARDGLTVDLVISNAEINDSSESIFRDLQNSGVNVYKAGAADYRDGGVMHNKFCVIDYSTVITGSYNWTRQAAINEENIVIFSDKKEADVYLQKFYTLRKNGSLFDFQTDQIGINLSVNNTLIEKGNKVKLLWKVNNADQVNISQIGVVELEGEQEVEINQDTTFVIHATNQTTENRTEKSILVRIIQEPVIHFTTSDVNLIRTDKCNLKWKVDHAENVKIEPNIGIVEAEGQKEVNPSESTVYTLVAEGMIKGLMKQKTVTINVFPTPILEKIQIPTPSNIKLEANFVNSRVEIPSSLDLGKIKRFSFNTPKIQHLNAQFIPNRPKVEDLSKALKIPKNDLYRSIGKSENGLRTKLFDKLEHAFRKNPKMVDVIHTIRRNYE